MKKNYLFGISAMAAMLFVTSCQEDDLVKQAQAGAEATVSINVTTPELGAVTRDFGDGTTAQTLHYAVYNVNSKGERIYLEELTEENHTFELSTKVDLQLVTGNTYDIIFWADADTDESDANNSTPYSIDWATATVSVDYDNVTSNNEDYDAFFNWITIEVKGAQTESVKLYRPFAQLNIGTSDIVAASQAGYTLQKTQVKVKAYETLNLWDKTVADMTDVVVDFKAADYPNYDANADYCLKPSTAEGYEAFPVSGYEYMAMNYLLRPVDKELVDVEFSFYSTSPEGEGELKERKYVSVPVQRNWRTNIYGQLITSEVDVNVEIVPAFDGAHNITKVSVDGVSYDNFADAVAAAMDLEKPVDFVENIEIDADETITIPVGKTLTLNLNGKTLTGVTDDADKNDDNKITSADNEVMFDVRGTMNVIDGIITVKHEGDNLGWNACTEIFYVGFNGTLNVENATLENYGGSDMAYAIDMVNADAKGAGITVNVKNSTIKSSYIPVRVFNNGTGMNKVTIKKTTLDGKSRAFWVHIYSKVDDKGFFNKGNDTNANGYKDETLNIDIFNPDNNNTFIANNPDRIIEYGFDDEINLNEFGGQIFKDENGDVVEGVGIMTDDKDNTTYYGVYTAEGLGYVAQQFNNDDNSEIKTFKLINDIDLAQASTFTRSSVVSNWTSIGTSENPFTGTFDGNGWTIKNLTLVEEEAKEGKAYIGFFGYAKDATIKNVVFENVYINIPCLDIDHSQGHIGAVAGSLEGTSTIENVTVKGDIQVEATPTANGASRVAVVAGGNSFGNVTMKNVHVVANEGSYLKANNNTGALAGQLQGKMVFENCSSNIDVTVNKFFAGGLIGIAAGDSEFKDCHTTGNVAVIAGREGRHNDEYRVGGIAGGWADNTSTPCVLTNCSYTGEVSGTNADGSVASPLDYMGYVGRGYTLANRAGSTVIIDGVKYVQAYNDVYGVYYYNGAIMEIAGVKAIVLQTENELMAVSVDELNLNGKNANDAATWAEELGEGWSLASIYDLDAIHTARVALNYALKANSADNALFCEEEYYADGKYALYISSTDAEGNDPQGEAYFSNRVHVKYFNLNGYWDYKYSTFATISKYAPLKDNYFARAVYKL